MVQPGDLDLHPVIDPSILVSVSIITYNQKEFISQTIESVMNQKTNFRFEIIVGDDLSTDGTREIVIEYQKRYPEVVKPILHPTKNEGLPGKLNFLSSVNACRGKYVALLDGDDYWTDPYKLQTQVNILEAHKEFVGCFHNTEERFEDDPDKASFLYCDFPSSRRVSFADLTNGNLIPTCSVVYRNRLFQEYPSWFYDMKMGDWPLHLMNARFGDFWYLPKVMGVHRLHSKSYWMMQDPARNNRYVVEAYDVMIKELGHEDWLIRELEKGKQSFLKKITPQPAPGKGTIVKRGINFLKRVIDK